jgi:hypothetical protein
MKTKKKQSRFSGTGVVVRLPLAQRTYIKRLVEQSDGLKSQSDVIREMVQYHISRHCNEFRSADDMMRAAGQDPL